jgi:hypothetical protein
LDSSILMQNTDKLDAITGKKFANCNKNYQLTANIPVT